MKKTPSYAGRSDRRQKLFSSDANMQPRLKKVELDKLLKQAMEATSYEPKVRPTPEGIADKSDTRVRALPICDLLGRERKKTPEERQTKIEQKYLPSPPAAVDDGDMPPSPFDPMEAMGHGP
jgi:hypothetical protein